MNRILWIILRALVAGCVTYGMLALKIWIEMHLYGISQHSIVSTVLICTLSLLLVHGVMRDE